MRFARNYWDKLKHHFYEVMKPKTTPHSIALGFAIGTFISILPTPFLNIFIGLAVVAVYEGINKFALFTSLIWWNPINLAPIYWLSYKVGEWIFGAYSIVSYELSLMDRVWMFSRRFLVGNLILAVVLSIVSYFLVKWFVIIYRKRKGIDHLN